MSHLSPSELVACLLHFVKRAAWTATVSATPTTLSDCVLVQSEIYLGSKRLTFHLPLKSFQDFVDVILKKAYFLKMVGFGQVFRYNPSDNKTNFII